MAPEDGPAAAQPTSEELVRMYLRGQNLEQMHRFDEAIEAYEAAVAARFDAAGPYDRLIILYRNRGAQADVRRIAEAALGNVRTFEDKKTWYSAMRDSDDMANPSDPTGPEF